MIKLRTASWTLKFNRRVERLVGGKPRGAIDMWFLLDDREVDPETEDMVMISVPQGREDIAQFVARSVMAGQRVIRGLPLGSPLILDEQPGFEEKINGNASAVREE
jgi:hypothetical protein